MAAPSIANPNFSTPALATNNSTATTTDGWTLGTAALVWRVDPNQFLNIGNSAATAWAQQTLTFPDSGDFLFRFKYGRRGQSGSILCGLYLDGSLIWSANTPAGPDNTFPASIETAPVAVAAGSRVLKVAAISNSSGFQAVFDDFSCEQVNLPKAYNEDARCGLAIGADVPPSLAIAREVWAGIEIGVGSGLAPSTTLVEDAVAGLAIGGDWPPSLAISRDAWAGIELHGSLAASLGSDPTTLRAAIYSRLRSSSALAAVVGPRVHHGRVPQRSEFPAVVFHCPGRSYGHNLGGGDGTSTATVQVDCWGTAPDQCEAAAEAVRLAFQAFRGRVGAVEFTGVFIDDVGETVERDAPGSDQWTYRTILMLEARHRVSIPATEG